MPQQSLGPFIEKEEGWRGQKFSSAHRAFGDESRLWALGSRCSGEVRGWRCSLGIMSVFEGVELM